MTTLKGEEADLQIVMVDSVYFPSQRLRIKTDDPNSVFKNYQGDVFGIFCTNSTPLASSTKNSTYPNQMGVMVNIVKEESLTERSPFVKNYTDFVVECTKRIIICQEITDFSAFEKSSQVINAKVQYLDENENEEEIQEVKETKLDETLRTLAIKY